MAESFQPSNKITGRAPVVLTIAGFDPSGGAGSIADIRTLTACGCFAVAAITSLTFQNSETVRGAIHQTANCLRAQVLPLIQAFDVAAVKTGMLPTREIILEVGRLIREDKLPAPVLDPVMQSSSGYELMNTGAVKTLLSDLLPLAKLITPNIPEAEALTGKSIADENEMRAAAAQLRKMGARAVLIKGGHLESQRPEVGGQKSEFRGQITERVGRLQTGRQAVDILDNEGAVTVFRADWIDGPPVRGTGCMLSSAIAAGVAKGMKLEDSISAAKNFVARTITEAVQLETRNSKLET